MANPSFNLTNFNAETVALNCPALELGVELSSNISCHLKTLTMNVTNNKGRNDAYTCNRQVSLIIDPREIDFIELKSKTGQVLGSIDLIDGMRITALGETYDTGTRCSDCQKMVRKPLYKKIGSNLLGGMSQPFCNDCHKL